MEVASHLREKSLHTNEGVAIMKKNLFAVAGLALAGMFMTGCAMVGTNNGSVVLGGGGVFSEMSANAVIP